MGLAPRALVILFLLALTLTYVGTRVLGDKVTTAGPLGTPGSNGTTGDQAVPEDEKAATKEGPEAGSAGGESKTSASTGGATASPTTSGQTSGSTFTCEPGRNGGRTDIGVSANKIRVATPWVEGGPMGELLKDSLNGMKAVITRVNRAGGVCGRMIDLQFTPVGFQSDAGHQAIKDYADPKSDIFALPVVASPPGLVGCDPGQGHLIGGDTRGGD